MYIVLLDVLESIGDFSFPPFWGWRGDFFGGLQPHPSEGLAKSIKFDLVNGLATCSPEKTATHDIFT